MAIRHVRAVQAHSQINDDLTRHILEVIALDIGHDDSPAHTSNRGIAARVRHSVNTVRKHLDEAIASGELIAVKDGKYWYYSLNTELIPVPRTSGDSRAEKGRKASGKQVATQEDLETLYQRLCQNNETLYQGLYQNIVSIVSSPSTELDTEVKESDKEKEKKKEYIYISPSSPKETIHTQEYLSDPIQAFVSEMQTICKTPYLFGNEPAYHEAAYYLHGEDANVSDIARFSEWWRKYGFYEGQPALKTIVESWRNFKNGVIPKVSKEKKRSDPNQIPDEYADLIQR